MTALIRTGLGLLLLLAASAAAAARPSLSWLQVEDAMLDRYAVERNAADTARLTIRPTWAEGQPAKTVMLLIPIKSVAAYSTSVSTVLRVFHERGVAAEFEVWFYDKDKDIAAEAVAWAEARPVDLIMAVGSSATEYLHAYYRGGKLPVVTAASKDPVMRDQMPDYELGSGTNIAYTSINVPMDTFVAYLFQLKPSLKVVTVMYDIMNGSAVETQVDPLKQAGPLNGLTVIDVMVTGEANAEAELRQRIPAAIDEMRTVDPTLEHSAFVVTGSTAIYARIGLVNQFTGRVPVVAMLPDVVQPGDDSAVVSIGVNLATAAQLSAVYAVDIVKGFAKAGELKVGVVSPPDIAISFRKARQIGLKIPFSFLESATFVYNYDGRLVRSFGQRVDLTN